MKKLLKGFTLIELIVVMAILSILMAGIMQMFKPIRETYVDSTLIESRRNAQTGVTQYITESIRFATDLGLYTKSGAGSITGAVNEFADKYLDHVGISTTDPSYANKKKAIQEYADVIIIDNTADAYEFNGDTYTGRLLRRKFVLDGSGVPAVIDNGYESISNSEKCRMALGAAYYGGSDYAIQLTVTDSAADGIGVRVSSTARYGLSRSLNKDDDTSKFVSTPAYVYCRNLTSDVSKIGLYDTEDITSGSSPIAPGTKVYIVWLDGDAKDIVEATT